MNQTLQLAFGFIAIVVTVRVVYHLRMEIRCTKEALSTPLKRHWNTTSKQESIDELIKAYSFELRGGDHGDAHLLPERLATCRQVHPDNSTREIGAILHWLSTARVLKAYVDPILLGQANFRRSGTSLKILLELEGNHKVIFKPKKAEIFETASALRWPQLGYDRHNADIAAFHLQRLLGFNRSPFVVGRIFDFLTEILPVANEVIRNSVTHSGDVTCMQFNIQRLLKKVCFKSNAFEGVMVLWLPRSLKTKHHDHDITYHQLSYPLDQRNRLLDQLEIVIFDYLIQNLDRQAYMFEPALHSALFIVDNGRGFNEPDHDDNTHFQEFSRRCQVRKSTYTRLKFLRGGVLSAVLRHILSRDPVAPVLWEPYYAALDRRLETVLQEIKNCMQKHGETYVLVQDDLVDLQKQYFLNTYTASFLNIYYTLLNPYSYERFYWYDAINLLLLLGVSCVFMFAIFKMICVQIIRYSIIKFKKIYEYTIKLRQVR